MVRGRVILLLMCVTRSTRPRTHHHRDNGVGGSRRRDAGWFGVQSTEARNKNRHSTTLPRELHDHKIILVLCHPACPPAPRSSLLAHSFTSLVPAPPVNERNERRKRARVRPRDARPTIATCLPASRFESSQIYRRTDDVVRTTTRQMTAGVIDRPDFATAPNVLLVHRGANARDRETLPGN